MKTRSPLIIAAALLLLAAVNVSADNCADHSKAEVKQASVVEMSTATVGDKAPDFTLADASGKKHTLSEFAGKFVVLEWVNFDCPFVKKHYGSGNMQRLQAMYGKKDVVWLSICSSAPGQQGYMKGEQLTASVKEHKSNAAAYLIDPEGYVGRMYNAKTTPNMYVVDPEGVLIYAGAIDDKPSVDPKDIAESTNYVSSALDMAMSGKKVQTAATQPYGCSVKYAKK